MGVSLGGSIATNLAVKHNSSGLALISSVDSIRKEIKSNLKVNRDSAKMESGWSLDRDEMECRWDGMEMEWRQDGVSPGPQFFHFKIFSHSC